MPQQYIRMRVDAISSHILWTVNTNLCYIVLLSGSREQLCSVYHWRVFLNKLGVSFCCLLYLSVVYQRSVIEVSC